MKGGIYWAQVWKGGVGMLERWDKEDWQEATMHKMKRKKMKRRTCVEEHANYLMLEAVWSTFRVPLIANIPIRLVTHLWKLVSATEKIKKGNVDFHHIILMFFRIVSLYPMCFHLKWSISSKQKYKTVDLKKTSWQNDPRFGDFLKNLPGTPN